MAEMQSAQTIDRDYLRGEALASILKAATAGLYCWLGALYFLSKGFTPSFGGPALLGGGLLLALLTRRRNTTLGAMAVALGLALASLYVIWQGDLSVAPYLLAAVVAMAGLFFGLHLVVGVAALCGVLIVAVGTLHLGHAPFSAPLLAPVLVILAIAIVSTTSTRSLRLALYWAWERAVAAQHNEKEARERRAELARATKALNEACQRLEYLNYDLAKAREAADEARQVKQRFMANVSHELRTPLNVIVAFSEMMYLSPHSYGGVPLPPEYRGDVREIYHSSQHLLGLIDDVLDVSELEARQMRLKPEAADLTQIVADAVDIMRPLVKGKDVELLAEIPEGLPLVWADTDRVRQVLINLLNNARRFTDHGRIVVQAAQDDGQVGVTVADTGIGITPEDQAKLFEPFTQLDPKRTAGRSGTGLGLTISKRLVEMHGGHIWVESEGIRGQGSRFHFTLPLARPGAAEIGYLRGTPLSLPRPSGRGRKLLLVDRDPDIVRLLEETLPEYQIVSLGDTQEAAGLVRELRPQAILCTRPDDQQMRELSEQLGPVPTPIIHCPLVGYRQLGESLGVRDYLVKPLSRATLLAVLDLHAAAAQRILVVEDDRRMANLVSRMILSSGRGYTVRRAYNGERGLHAMREWQPQLVFLDLVMPDLDGYAVLAKMREEEALRTIPVVVVTAHARTHSEERLMSGRSLQVIHGAGFTNEEALKCLTGILEVFSASPTLWPGSYAVESGEEVRLGDRLAQICRGSQ